VASEPEEAGESDASELNKLVFQRQLAPRRVFIKQVAMRFWARTMNASLLIPATCASHWPCWSPSSVENAIFNATGKPVRDLPITPDKINMSTPVQSAYLQGGITLCLARGSSYRSYEK
jgi:hypothetical protein